MFVQFVNIIPFSKIFSHFIILYLETATKNHGELPLARRGKEKTKKANRKRSFQDEIIELQQQQLILQQEQGHCTQQFLDTMLEKQNA